MRVKIEDLVTNQTREEECPFPNLGQFQRFLLQKSEQNGLGFYILLKGRGKFIEVWDSNGRELLERYTRIDK